MSNAAVPIINREQAQRERIKNLLVLLYLYNGDFSLKVKIAKEYINPINSLTEQNIKTHFSAIAPAVALGFLSLKKLQALLMYLDKNSGRNILDSAIIGFGWSNKRDAAEVLAKQYELKHEQVDWTYYYGQGLSGNLDYAQGLVDSKNFTMVRAYTLGLGHIYNFLKCPKNVKDAVYNKIMGLADFEVTRVMQAPPTFEDQLSPLKIFFGEIIEGLTINGSADMVIQAIDSLNKKLPGFFNPLLSQYIYPLLISRLRNPNETEIVKMLTKLETISMKQLPQQKSYCEQVVLIIQGSFEQFFKKRPVLTMADIVGILLKHRHFSQLIDLQQRVPALTRYDRYLVARYALNYFINNNNIVNNQEFIDLLFRLYRDMQFDRRLTIEFLIEFCSHADTINFSLKNPKNLLRILSCVEDQYTRKSLLLDLDFILTTQYDDKTIDRLLELTDNIVELLSRGVTRTQAINCITDGMPHDSSDLGFLAQECDLEAKQIQIIASYLPLPCMMDVSKAHMASLFDPAFLNFLVEEGYLPSELIQIIAEYLSPLDIGITQALLDSFQPSPSPLQMICRHLHPFAIIASKHQSMAAIASASSSTANSGCVGAVPGGDAVECKESGTSELPMAPPAAPMRSESSTAAMCLRSYSGSSSLTFFGHSMQAASSSPAATSASLSAAHSTLNLLLSFAKANHAPDSACDVLRELFNDDAEPPTNTPAEQKQPALRAIPH